MSLLVEFELVSMMHSSFTAATPTGEAEGGWPVCLWRCFKVPAAALKVAAENYLVDSGIEGSNGKGILWNIMFHCLGGYTQAVTDQLLTHDPPPPGSANPALIKLRGCRILGTPESSGSVVKVDWVKMFADASTIWSARDLYCGVDFDFYIPCIFTLSTNNDFNLAKIDGGIRRRGLGAQWDIHFTERPKAVHERQAHPDGNKCKLPSFYTPLRKAGYMYFLLKTMKVSS